MVKVLLDDAIFRIYGGGGIARYFSEIIPCTAESSKDIGFYVAASCAAFGAGPLRDRVKTFNSWNLRPWRFWRHVNEIRLRQFQRNAHIFTTTFYQSKPVSNLKSVVVVYDLVNAAFPWVHSHVPSFVVKQKRVIEAADAIVAISGATKQDILRYTSVSEEKISVVYPAASESMLRTPGMVSIELFRQTYGITGSYWLYVGAREYYKNFTCMLQAFSKMAERDDSRLVIVGGEPGLTPAEVDFIVQHHLEHRVHVLGRIPDSELAAAYAGATAFVYPSLMEGFGIPLLEAMGCGAAVLAADIPVFHEVAQDAALFFDPRDPDSLVARMLEIKQGLVKAELIRKGRDRVCAFSWKKSAAQLADIYRKVAKNT